MIQNIDIYKIYPHPNNPRKDLGDLTELAESIKARGILQNLTVVPERAGYCPSCTIYNSGIGKCTEGHDKNNRPPCPEWKSNGNYTVVIGHRRLAAAKLAGMTEVPCVISDMDHRDQVATMLLENIQRSDLTPIEQAQGFQMMMNLGETVAGIAGKTGFSDGTIRKRLALVKLDQKKLQESYARGGTLMDYAKLEQLKDDKAKNKVLESIGTRDFDWNLKNAIDEQEKPARKEALLKVLNEFAKKVKNTGEIKGGYSYEKYFGGFQMGEWKKPKDADKAEYYYTAENGGASLYKKVEKAEKKELSPAEKSYNKRESQMKNLAKRAYESRYEFIRNFSDTKNYAKEIRKFAFESMFTYGRTEPDKMLEVLGIEKPDTKDMDWSEAYDAKKALIIEKYVASPEKVMLFAAYLTHDDGASKKYYDAQSWNGFKIKHSRNGNLDTIYDTLISLGYEMSDEEQQLRDGTHELFDKPKEVQPKEDPVETQNAEEGLFYCTQDNCSFNDREGGCQFDPEEADGEDFFRDIQEAILTYDCQNSTVKTEYDKLFEESAESGEEE